MISLGGRQIQTRLLLRPNCSSWITASERIALVEKLYQVYKSRAEDLALAMSLEMGAPIEMSRTQQVGAGIWHLKDFIRVAKEFNFDTAW